MNSLRYKTLLSYLPGMASVVNSFTSERVQVAVFDRLISALEEKTESDTSSGKQGKNIKADAGTTEASSGELEHDIVEGGSIHSVTDTDS